MSTNAAQNNYMISASEDPDLPQMVQAGPDQIGYYQQPNMSNSSFLVQGAFGQIRHHQYQNVNLPSPQGLGISFPDESTRYPAAVYPIPRFEAPEYSEYIVIQPLEDVFADQQVLAFFGAPSTAAFSEYAATPDARDHYFGAPSVSASAFYQGMMRDFTYHHGDPTALRWLRNRDIEMVDANTIPNEFLHQKARKGKVKLVHNKKEAEAIRNIITKGTEKDGIGKKRKADKKRDLDVNTKIPRTTPSQLTPQTPLTPPRTPHIPGTPTTPKAPRRRNAQTEDDNAIFTRKRKGKATGCSPLVRQDAFHQQFRQQNGQLPEFSSLVKKITIKKKVVLIAISEGIRDAFDDLLAQIPKEDMPFDVEISYRPKDTYEDRVDAAKARSVLSKGHSPVTVSWNIAPFTVLNPRKALREFTLFPHLPLELQLMIWKFARQMMPIRIVELAVVRSQIQAKPAMYRTIATPINYRIPAMLHVNSLARRTVLKFMPLSFQNFHDQIRGIYFFPERDILRLQLPSAQALAKTNASALWDASSLIVPREKTHKIELVFAVDHTIEMYRSMADLILRSPHCSWPSVKGWNFPSIPKPGQKTVWAEVKAKWQDDVEGAEKAEARNELGDVIWDAVVAKQEEHMGKNVGVIATYVYPRVKDDTSR